MKTEFALDYIPRRMCELGYGTNYITRWRHLQIDARSTLNIDADNDDLLTITRIINGGLNGLDDREAYLYRAKQVFEA